MSAAQLAPADSEPVDPEGTGPLRLRALLTALTLTPGPMRLPASPPTARGSGGRALRGCGFLGDRTSVEVITDDLITLAETTAACRAHPIPLPSPRWVLTVIRTPSLDAVPHAFIGTPTIRLRAIDARYSHDPNLGHTWWIPPSLIVHNNRRSRWIGVRYTDPRAARDWTSPIVARLLATPMSPWPPAVWPPAESPRPVRRRTRRW